MKQYLSLSGEDNFLIQGTDRAGRKFAWDAFKAIEGEFNSHSTPARNDSDVLDQVIAAIQKRIDGIFSAYHGEYNEDITTRPFAMADGKQECILMLKQLRQQHKETQAPCTQPCEECAHLAAEIVKRQRGNVLETLGEWLDSDDHLSLYKWEVREQIRTTRQQQGGRK